MKTIGKPSWLKVRLPSGENYLRIKGLIDKHKIHTICHEALCPNLGECSDMGTATFLLLGDKCTRNCLYCNVKFGKPSDTDKLEPGKIADAVKVLNLSYVVITSVTRDDLDDGGAFAFADTIEDITRVLPSCKIETLAPDFNGRIESVKKVIEAIPFVFAHNIEVVEDLFPVVRPQGDYRRSLKVLRTAKEFNVNQKTKSGIMIGLGETKIQIVNTMKDIRSNYVDVFTIGQYLQPSRGHCPVKKYYTPDEFMEFENIGYDLGFSFVKAGPLVRSSYMAECTTKVVSARPRADCYKCI